LSSWVLSAVPSIDAMIRSLAPLVIWLSICWVWVGMSFLGVLQVDLVTERLELLLQVVTVADPALRGNASAW